VMPGRGANGSFPVAQRVAAIAVNRGNIQQPTSNAHLPTGQDVIVGCAHRLKPGLHAFGVPALAGLDLQSSMTLPITLEGPPLDVRCWLLDVGCSPARPYANRPVLHRDNKNADKSSICRSVR
jgi:hypothetical protein